MPDFWHDLDVKYQLAWGYQMHRQPLDNESLFLCGWKDIAQYLGMGVRTVQRYEQYLGLPVRRASRNTRALVIATKEELDAWINARPLAHAFALHHKVLDVASLKAFRMALAEQRQLRDEVRKMREELHATVETLHATAVGAWHEDFRATPPVEKYRKPN